MEHITEAGPVTMAGPGPAQPGDFVQSTGVGKVYGYVFDIIGDVVRVHWTTPGTPGMVEGLSPHKAEDLWIVYRPDAYLAVRFTGDGEDAPYAFVYASSSLAEAADTERTFLKTGNYEIHSSRFGLAQDDPESRDGGGDGARTDQDSGMPDS